MNKADVNLKRLFDIDEWTLTENKLPTNKFDIRLSESITSLGNEYMGMRGNFEESFTGESHQGAYIGGVWYPDKTVVGWWKNGYPNYFGKAVNALHHIGLKILVNNEELDLQIHKPKKYKRTLNMYDGILIRKFTTTIKEVEVEVEVRRFFSLKVKELCAIEYSITPMKDVEIEVESYLYGDVVNIDSNYGEKFWEHVNSTVSNNEQLIHTKLKENNFGIQRFEICANSFFKTNLKEKLVQTDTNDSYSSSSKIFAVKKNQKLIINKYIVITNSQNFEPKKIENETGKILNSIKFNTFDELLDQHKKIWHERWKKCDVKIYGSPEDQQAIRFNLFQLFCTYYGNDERLNIGPKGFTGEKYGGATYWDTEAYCVPLYLKTSNPSVTKALLKYRFNHLENAIKNSKKLGLDGALYPMVTFNGEECHNEWEITFEEIHRNAAIAYAIFNYVNYTGDEKYLKKFGLRVLIEISKFWASRVHWHEQKKVWMIHGVTGPNEYENNINNNWLTNLMAQWTLKYTLESIDKLKIDISKFNLKKELIVKFSSIVEKIYLPIDKNLNIFVQHDGFLDKELLTKEKLSKDERPLNKNWSWDKILRSPYIKQADVLQGIYYLWDKFSEEEIKSNFDFYEQFTVHESSLSPCIHSIIAARINRLDKAYEFYSRTARLDLDNYNNDTDDGLHITSMTGSYLAIVEGFAGMIVRDKKLFLKPKLPKEWKGYEFNINFLDRIIKIKVIDKETEITLVEGEKITINVDEKDFELIDVLKVKV